MAIYVLDTGILLGFVRGAPYAEYVSARYAPTETPNAACVSAVTVGEILCFPIRRNWGDKKRKELNDLLKTIPAVEINRPAILQRYAEIDTYCGGHNPDKPLPEGQTAKPMGKNDLWIAATTSVINAYLITTDQHFLFLKDVFLDVIYVDPKQK